MAYIAGLRGTGDWGTDERPKDFRETILWLDPNGTAPITALMSKMGSEGLTDPEFSWWEERQSNVRIQLDTAIASAATTAFVIESFGEINGVPVAGAENGLSTGGLSLSPGDLLRLEAADGTVLAASEEIVLVTVVTDDNNITVSRGFAGTTALTVIATESYFLKIGSAFAEGASSPQATTKNPVKFTNFAQIFRNTYEITETAKKTKARTGDALMNDKKRKMFDHARDQELAYLFGADSETTGSNGKPLRTTRGIIPSITTNNTIFDGSPAFTEDNFIDAISPMFDYTHSGMGNERIGFCGNGALTALNKLARDSSSSRINHTETVKLWGMEMQKWVIPQGTILLRTHPLFNVHPVYKNSMVAINPKGIVDRALRKTRQNNNIELPGDDLEKGEWLTESGLEFRYEDTHAYLGNMV